MKRLSPMIHRLETLMREVINVAGDLSFEIDGLPAHDVQLDHQLRHLAVIMFKTSGKMMVILFKHSLKAKSRNGKEIKL